MKKGTLIKKITTMHEGITDTIQKIRDLVYLIEDPDLDEKIDSWCEEVESYLYEDGNLDGIIESIEEVFDEYE